MTATHLLIVNPRSANGSTSRRWPRIEERLRASLPPFDTAFTSCPGDATRLAREGAGRYEVVVAVGGDGTINEAVNGLIADTGNSVTGAALGIIPRGTGSDFVRTMRIPHSVSAAAAVLARGERREVDVGRVRLQGTGGRTLTRLFINEAEAGMGAAVSDTVNRSSKRFGGAVTFAWGALTTLLRYRDHPVEISIDGSPPEGLELNNAWIANGRCSGGGMRSAPRARPDDGQLDIVIIRHAGALMRLRTALGLRNGRFVRLPHVSYQRGRRVEITGREPVPVEVEGELIGVTPATFDLLPVRLPVMAPAADPVGASLDGATGGHVSLALKKLTRFLLHARVVEKAPLRIR